jgi:hypothetical protein
MTRSEGLRKAVAVKGVEHGQTCTKELTGAMALRAALESAFRLGRGLARRRSEQASQNGHSNEI